MKSLFVLFFVMLGLFCHAQKELFVINKNNEKKQMRIAKGSFLRIKTSDGKKHSGTMVKVNDFTIVLVAYDATIDIEEIESVKIIYRKAALKSFLFPGGAVFNQAIGKESERRFKMQDWTLLIKNG